MSSPSHSYTPLTNGVRKWPLYLSRRARSLSQSSSWRPAQVLDEYVQKEARPISLRQLFFFGRTLTENRLLSSANYVRTELPVRLAHRIRDMQTLPYVIVTNPHISHVYELYYKAFENFRRVPELQSVEDNEEYCKLINETLIEHLTVIPRLAMGVLECRDLMKPDDMDHFVNTILKSRISRRVIAEQHLALTESFESLRYTQETKSQLDLRNGLVGEVFLKCNAQEVVRRCGDTVQRLAREAYGDIAAVPEISLEGHLDATFPYILSHLEYIIGELLRNSVQAVVERSASDGKPPPPIKVLVCEAPQHVIIRISDEGGGVPQELLPYVWSFSKGPRTSMRLKNLIQVPKMAATMQEIQTDRMTDERNNQAKVDGRDEHHESSLSSLTSRPPNLRLGMGLPMSRVYAEFWAGNLELHSLEGYGVDVFLQISKLGNKNEQLTTRAIMDSV